VPAVTQHAGDQHRNRAEKGEDGKQLGGQSPTHGEDGLVRRNGTCCDSNPFDAGMR